MLTLMSTLLLSACNDESAVQTRAQNTVYPYSEGDDIPALAYIEHNEVYNPESVIPPQCYTKTNGKNNPCYACHQSYDKSENRPNQMGDGTLQGNYTTAFVLGRSPTVGAATQQRLAAEAKRIGLSWDDFCTVDNRCF